MYVKSFGIYSKIVFRISHHVLDRIGHGISYKSDTLLMLLIRLNSSNLEKVIAFHLVRGILNSLETRITPVP